MFSAELMANKIPQSHLIKGMSLFGNQIKLSQNKFGLTRTNFLRFYQVIHAIPKNLVSKALATKLCSNSSELQSNSTLFDLEPEVKLNLTTMKSRDFYSLFVNKSYAEEQTGVMRWNKIVTMGKKSWQSAFTSVRTTSKYMILREFYFKFLHRMTVTKKELFRFGLKADCACLYCSEPDSIDYTFIQCQFLQCFIKKIVQWFNQTNKTNFNPGQRETIKTIRVNVLTTLCYSCDTLSRNGSS